jgi:hypothetical protein
MFIRNFNNTYKRSFFIAYERIVPETWMNTLK